MKKQFVRCALALVLALCVGAGKAMAQKEIDKMIQTLEKRNDVITSLVIKRDPKTHKIKRIVKSFSLENEELAKQMIAAFEKSEEYAETVTKDMSNGKNGKNLDYTLIYRSETERRTYSLEVKEKGNFSITVNITQTGSAVSSLTINSDTWVRLDEQLAELNTKMENIHVEIPEIEVPQIEIPEIEIPKIEIPDIKIFE